MTDTKDLQQIREQIDTIDQQIETLINRRVNCALEIARVKSAHAEPSFYRPEREAQVLRRILKHNQGPLPDADMARLFREIMSVTLAREQPVVISVLGPEGTFTQSAAYKQFGYAARIQLAPTISDVFRMVETEESEFGVVPVENSTEGIVTDTLDSLMETSLKICGEVELRIHHQLMTLAPERQAIKEVLAHSQTMAQCRHWIDNHLPQAVVTAVSSNAEAARRAATDASLAAIASESAAGTYGLQILENNIEDDPANTTRFVVIGRLAAGISGKDKTSLLLSGRNRPGALLHLLEPLARHGVSMSRIESRPSPRALWEYVFFIDVEGHQDDEPLLSALVELTRESAAMKILGSYPKAVW